MNTVIDNRAGTAPSLGLWMERVLWLSWVPLVLFTIFFAPVPDIHNGMHPLRHSTTVVQCH
ncbi:MAG: hypothetical protein R8J85_02900 [Mariprofundales bacterium]